MDIYEEFCKVFLLELTLLVFQLRTGATDRRASGKRRRIGTEG